MSQKKRFDQVGQLAIEPAALSVAYGAPAPAEPFALEGDTAIVSVCGPLLSRADMCFDGYDAITNRVRLALESPAARVVLRIDSPGGMVSGCLAASRQLRRMAGAAGKPLVSYIDECATSAGYALACAAEKIVLPSTGRVGSIGVIEVLPSFARAQAASGVDVTVITSGDRKADGSPAILMTDDARAALQLGVDRMAEAFWDLVSEHRGVARDQVASQQAAVYYGSDAIKAGLADAVSDFPTMLATISNPQGNQAMKLADVKAGLEKMAESADPAEAAAAKRMLAAAEEPPAEDEEKKEPEAKAEGEGEEKKEPEAKAEGEDAPPPSEKKEPEASGDAKAVAALASSVARLEKAEIDRLASERAALFAARPDVPKAVREALAGASNEAVKAALAAIVPPHPAAAESVTGTRGESQSGGLEGVTYLSEHAARLDAEMGIAPMSKAVVIEGNQQIFGKPVKASK